MYELTIPTNDKYKNHWKIGLIDFCIYLAILCSNCRGGCFYKNICYNYDPYGYYGPPNVQSCEYKGGIDCSGKLYFVLKNPAV